MVKIARTGISTSNGHNFQTKKDIGYPLVPKFSSFRGLSSTLSWKCPHITLSPSFGLFQSEKWQKRVFQVGLTRALWPKTYPWDHFILKKDVTANFVKVIFMNFGWNDDLKSFFCIVGTSWMVITQLFTNIAYVGSFKHFSVQLFFTCILQLDQDQR